MGVLPHEAHLLRRDPRDTLTRLAALVPPPRVHTVRYHGAFAPNARGRAALTGRRPSPPRRAAAADPTPPPPPLEEEHGPAADPSRPRRLPWADLLRRVHRVEVLICARCQGRLRVLAFLTMPDVTAVILTHLGLPATPPAIAPARSPPQVELFEGWSDHTFADPPSLAQASHLAAANRRHPHVHTPPGPAPTVCQPTSGGGSGRVAELVRAEPAVVRASGRLDSA